MKIYLRIAWFLSGCVAMAVYGFVPLYAATVSYTSNDTWNCPTDITSVTVEVWGGGGGGGGSSTKGAGGGGGGAYSIKANISVTPGNNYTVTVGSAGTGGVSGASGYGGGISWFENIATVMAKGGEPGTFGSPGSAGGGGSSVQGVGDTVFSGGSGDAGAPNTGGGGGSSAGTAANGNGGSGTTGGAAPTGGGIGGDGGAASTSGSSPVSGNGGGGGGSGKTAGSGGDGAGGKVVITYNYAPSVTLDNDFASLSSGTIIVNYNMIDPDSDPTNLTNNGALAGVEWSTDGSTWGSDATMGTGGDGSTGLTSSPTSGTDHKFAWDSSNAADLAGVEDNTVYVRFAPNDGTANGSWVISNAFAVDNKDPVEATLVHLEALPASGDASFLLDAAFTEGNPGTNVYGYNLNAAGYVTNSGSSNTADPAPLSFSVALNGDDKFTAIKCTHTDDMGNAAVSEDLSGVYVKPLTPSAPSLANPGQTTLQVTLNNPADGAGMFYVIRATSTEGTFYVQTDGSLAAGPAAWYDSWPSPVNVTGLTENTDYWFSAAAGNPQDLTPSEGENSASPYGASAKATTLPPPPKNLEFMGGLTMQGLILGN